MIILKSEDIQALEEANEVLLDYYRKKNKSTGLIVEEKKIHYDVDFLLQFKDRQFNIGTETQNLTRFLRIRRDDYLLIEGRFFIVCARFGVQIWILWSHMCVL